MSVQVPPRSEANATGIRNFDGDIFNRRAIPMAGGMKIGVTAELFIQADIPATVAVRPSRTRCGLPPMTRCTARPTASVAPVRTSAEEITKMPMRRKMIGLTYPVRASAGVRIRDRQSTTRTRIVDRSTGSFSVAIRTMTKARSPRTSAIAGVNACASACARGARAAGR